MHYKTLHKILEYDFLLNNLVLVNAKLKRYE